MPSLLSGSLKNTSSPTGYAKPTKVQYQLGPSPTTSTGYTLIANAGSLITYVSSLGNIQFSSGTMYSNLPNQNINIIGTGTSTVIVSGGTINVSTNTGALQVIGGIGISDGLYTGKDIHVNKLTIGQGYQGQNNIVIQGVSTTQTNQGLIGQNSIVIGFDALNGLSTSLNNIAIGRYALSSGTLISNTVAIGDSALKNLGTTQTQYISAIQGVNKLNPIQVVSNGHGLTTGTQILIKGIAGTTQLNFNTLNYYYVSIINANTVALYSDVDLITSVDGTSYGNYVTGGAIYTPVFVDSNIAVGTNAGLNFFNGEQNFFLGNSIATNFTTGSYNFFIGHEVANNMTHGNANISIGGDNLVDGLDNQINIGAVFYYNGGGYLQLNADTGVGLGSLSTTTDSGALVVYGGVGISNNMNIGGPVSVQSNASSSNISTGALVIGGGVGVGQDLYVGRELNVTGNNGNVKLSPQAGNVTIEPTLGGTVNIYPTTTSGSMDNIVIGASNATTAHFTDAYANNFIGLATTATNLAGGSLGGIPYQIGTGATKFIRIGAINTVLTSNGTTATWTSISALSNTSTHADNIFMNAVEPSNTYYLALSTQTNIYSNLEDDTTFTYVTTPATTSSYFITGTSVLNVPGSIYSMDGGANENNLLYTPRVVVGPTPPAVPRVGDFWIDSSANAQYQYIQDGTNRFWLQIAII